MFFSASDGFLDTLIYIKQRRNARTMQTSASKNRLDVSFCIVQSVGLRIEDYDAEPDLCRPCQ